MRCPPAAGIDGIVNELPLEDPVEENLYHFTDEDLKRRMTEVEAARRDYGVLRAALGDDRPTGGEGRGARRRDRHPPEIAATPGKGQRGSR